MEIIQVSRQPQVFTSVWRQVGVEIDTEHITSVAAWVRIERKNSTGLKIRVMATTQINCGKQYNMPIKAAYKEKVEIRNEYFEFKNNTDEYIVFSFDVERLVPYILFQISDDNNGGAILEDLKVTKTLYGTGNMPCNC